MRQQGSVGQVSKRGERALVPPGGWWPLACGRRPPARSAPPSPTAPAGRAGQANAEQGAGSRAWRSKAAWGQAAPAAWRGARAACCPLRHAWKASSPEVGSSRNRMRGSARISTAMFTRRRSPPLTPRTAASPTNVSRHLACGCTTVEGQGRVQARRGGAGATAGVGGRRPRPQAALTNPLLPLACPLRRSPAHQAQVRGHVRDQAPLAVGAHRGGQADGGGEFERFLHRQVGEQHVVLQSTAGAMGSRQKGARWQSLRGRHERRQAAAQQPKGSQTAANGQPRSERAWGTKADSERKDLPRCCPFTSTLPSSAPPLGRRPACRAGEGGKRMRRSVGAGSGRSSTMQR